MATQSVSILGQGVKVLGRPHPQQGEVDDQQKPGNKNGMRSPYLLRKPISFNMGSNMMEITCQSVVVSLLYFFFAVVCWGSSVRAGKSNTLNKLTRKAGSVILEPIEPK